MTIALIFMLVISGIGILSTAYHSLHEITNTKVPCLFFPEEWCEKVRKSPYSKLFNTIPNPIIGFIMFTSIFAISWNHFIDSSNGMTLAYVIIGIGFLFSMYFTYIQGYILKAFCSFCVISSLLFTVLFLLSLFSSL